MQAHQSLTLRLTQLKVRSTNQLTARPVTLRGRYEMGDGVKRVQEHHGIKRRLRSCAIRGNIREQFAGLERDEDLPASFHYP